MHSRGIVGENAMQKRSYNLRSVNVVEVTGEYERTPLHVALLRKRNYSQYSSYKFSIKNKSRKVLGWPSLVPIEFGLIRKDSLIFHQNGIVPDTPVDIAHVKKLIKAGANVNAVDVKDNSCLHYAVENEDCCKLISILVNADAEVDSLNTLGDTPFLTAVRVNNLEAVDNLIKCGANIKIGNNHGDTCLHLANDEAMVSFLLKAGAGIESVNKIGDTPLLAATRENNLKKVNFLIKNRANINSLNVKGENCLHLARNDSMLCMLLDNGCSPQINSTSRCGCSPLLRVVDYCGINTLTKVIQAGANVNFKHKESSACRRHTSTPLKMAIEMNREEIAEILLKHGANPNETCGDHKSILFYASLFGYSKTNPRITPAPLEDEKFANILQLLINHKANVCLDTEAFEAVIKHGSLRAILLFLNEYERKKIFVPVHRHLLHLALHNSRDDVFKIILRSKPELLNQVDEEGFTPLHRAIELIHINEDRAKILLDHGADINTVNNRGRSLLDTALSLPTCAEFRSLRIQFLLSYGSLPTWRINMVNLNANAFGDVLPFWRETEEGKNIVRHIALIQSTGRPIARGILHTIRKNWFVSRTQLYDKCITEIQLARTSIIHDSTTVYDILTKVDYRFAKNRSSVEELNSEDFYKRFPIYESLIRNRLEESRNMLERFVESVRGLNRILNLDYSTFYQIYEYILCRLRPIDQLNLSHI
ncbi:hypothetical protein QAD02_016220 [Eretmocerus hayati]|uniref:Uncharacterized protein n=1 Tax=Eretmocerus hayati TaxID=131215 RepID=A0ACC2PBH6_9HYME|nr:hypothetical protein QAD02_016220 [Eretmocerus hayati]